MKKLFHFLAKMVTKALRRTKVIAKSKLAHAILIDYTRRLDFHGLVSEALLNFRWHFLGKKFGMGAEITTPAENEFLNEAIGIFIHAHYTEEFERIAKLLSTFPLKFDLYITTTDDQKNKIIREYLRGAGLQGEVKTTPNKGRNFGPLLVEYSKTILTYRTIIHFHVKKSFHVPRDTALEWYDRSVKLFLEDHSQIEGSRRLLSTESKYSIIYPDVRDLLAPANFRFGNSIGKAGIIVKRIYSSDEKLTQLPFDFPAGGMFWLRVEKYRQLFESEWTYDMFPEESGQLDGTSQHALERLFGWGAGNNTSSHAIFNPHRRGFFETFKS